MGSVDQAGREVDAATLAAGEVLDQPVAELADVEALDQLVGDLARGTRAPPAQARHQDDVLARRQVLVQCGELPGQGDQSSHLVGLVDHVVSSDAGATGVWAQERREHPHHRRLARAVGTEEGDDCPCLDAEVERVDRGEVTEALRQSVRLDCG